MKNIKKNFVMAFLATTLSSGAFAVNIEFDLSALPKNAPREDVVRAIQEQAQQNPVLLRQVSEIDKEITNQFAEHRRLQNILIVKTDNLKRSVINETSLYNQRQEELIRLNQQIAHLQMRIIELSIQNYESRLAIKKVPLLTIKVLEVGNDALLNYTIAILDSLRARIAALTN